MTIQECKEKLNEILNVYCEQALYSEAKEKLMEIKPIRLINIMCGTYRKFNVDEKEILTMLIKIIQAIYNNSPEEEMISDELYDKIYQVYVDQCEDEIVGAPIYNLDESSKVSHRFEKLRGTITKSHFVTDIEKPENENRKSIEYFENSWKRQIGESLFNKINLLMSIKWDGISANLEFDSKGKLLRVLPRGNIRDNITEDKYDKFKDLNINGFDLINEDPVHLPDEEFCVKCELVCSEKALNELNQKYEMGFKNRRSAVSGLINSDNTPIELMRYVTIKALRYQCGITGDETLLNYHGREDEYKIVEYSAVNNHHKAISKYIKELKQNAQESGFPADGVVLTIMNNDIQKILGRDDDRGINKYEVAYKFPPEIGTSELINVEFTTGTMGNITPVAKIKPIKLKGNTIKSISLGSMDRFYELDLCHGDEVRIKYDVIPYLYKDDECETGDIRIEEPRFCEYCGHLLQENPMLMCVNEDCSCRQIGKIVNYINKMNILDISTETITTLYEQDIIRDILDLYSLKIADLVKLEGFGIRKATNIITRINENKKLFDYQLLGSIGIPSIGRQMFKKVISVYSIQELIDMCENENKAILKLIETVPGVKEKTATKIVVGINRNYMIIMGLLRLLDVKSSRTENKGKVCFTNVRNKEVEQQLEDLGYEIVNSVTKDTSYLIIPNGFNGTSSKLDKAKRYGVKIITIDSIKLRNMMKGEEE